ncbi:tetratricopeptide repeat protein [Streptomyces noursei]|uniref:tetratricopeptide repeat protein n=1 Tax=Streptomyces noursei TaxID=1971 RepID=UPI0035E05619
MDRLLEEADWSYADLARAVNRIGREMGHDLHYDRSAVGHWKRGIIPRKPAARRAICEALSRRLRRPVTLAEAGLGESAGAKSKFGETDTVVAELVELGRADMDPSRRGVMLSGLYSAALAVPGWADAEDRFARVRNDPHTRIGHVEVAAVRAMTEHISSLDDQFGGRMARPLAAAFTVNTIAPYLTATATDDVRKAMLSAASDHLYLTGYMAMDERADRLALRYYVKALELARSAHDHLTYCTTLRGMSVQAVDLGDGNEAVRLAAAAAEAAPQAGPRMQAFLSGQQAHAAAQTGDRSGALLWIKHAEATMERAESQAKAFGSYDPSSLAYHVGQVRFELGDIKGSIEALEEANRLREPVYRRARIRHSGMLAERKLRLGHLEEACQVWGGMLVDYPHVQSGRCDDTVRRMMSGLRPHTRNGYARELYERGRQIVQATA